MTAYADFEFYRDDFLGEKIPEDRFSQYALRASERIDELTFNRLKNAEDIPEEVKNACCAAAEVLYISDCASEKSEKGISSEKVGEYSVNYASASGQASDRNVSAAVRRYLLYTGLMRKVVEQ